MTDTTHFFNINSNEPQISELINNWINSLNLNKQKLPFQLFRELLISSTVLPKDTYNIDILNDKLILRSKESLYYVSLCENRLLSFEKLGEVSENNKRYFFVNSYGDTLENNNKNFNSQEIEVLTFNNGINFHLIANSIYGSLVIIIQNNEEENSFDKSRLINIAQNIDCNVDLNFLVENIRNCLKYYISNYPLIEITIKNEAKNSESLNIFCGRYVNYKIKISDITIEASEKEYEIENSFFKFNIKDGVEFEPENKTNAEIFIPIKQFINSLRTKLNPSQQEILDSVYNGYDKPTDLNRSRSR